MGILGHTKIGRGLVGIVLGAVAMNLITSILSPFVEQWAIQINQMSFLQPFLQRPVSYMIYDPACGAIYCQQVP